MGPGWLRRWAGRLLAAAAIAAVLSGALDDDDGLDAVLTAKRSVWPRRQPALYVKRAAIYLPGYDLRLEMRRTLLHCDQQMYEVEALALGERGWPGAWAMYELGQVDVIVTTSNSGHTTEAGIEVAGAGRTAIRTPARAARLRQIADLVDSGLSTGEIIRSLTRR